MVGLEAERVDLLRCTDGDQVVLGLGAGGAIPGSAGVDILDDGSNDEEIFTGSGMADAYLGSAGIDTTPGGGNGNSVNLLGVGAVASTGLPPGVA